ncbi:hypothetical protein CA265_17625 [Sphingobacteriaceae bacterium GW460-11-11-14-LB5]|nr:hypothetical protein CA265_17625 [Sphingobacteriaceae bacterium GW460-11-11-14-LB5]
MKKITLFILLFTAAINSFAQEAKLSIKNLRAKNNTVIIQIPVDDTWFYPAKKELKFGDDSTVNYALKINKLAWLRINNNTVLIEPGTTHLVFDKGLLVQSDKNKEGMLLFNKRNVEFYQYRARNYYKKDSTAAGLYQLLENDQNEALKPYTELFSKHKISANFYNEIKRYFSTEQIILQAAIPMVVFSAKQKINNDLDKMWADAYKKYSMNNLRDAFYPDFYYHAKYYVSTYLNYYLPLKNGTQLPKRDEDIWLKSIYKTFEDNYTGKMKEFLLATFLYEEMLQTRYQKVLVDLFDSFKASYPKSNFAPYLQPTVNEIITYHNKVKNDFEPGQKMLANYDKFNTLDSLIGQFKDKTVFVDIWATWCGPCKQEFEYSKDLEQFLKAKQVEMLFISIDKDDAAQQWKEMIKYFKLSGNHVRTNQALRKDLSDKLGKDGSYGIPRYLIIKNGKLVVADALRPSDKEKLYAQISKYL